MWVSAAEMKAPPRTFRVAGLLLSGVQELVMRFFARMRERLTVLRPRYNQGMNATNTIVG